MLRIDVPTVEDFRVLLRREYVYLNRALAPFNVCQIRKSDVGDGFEQLVVLLEDGQVMYFPEFEAGRYYKGMIPEYAYSAEILCLYDAEYGVAHEEEAEDFDSECDSEEESEDDCEDTDDEVDLTRLFVEALADALNLDIAIKE